ncbi:hypothetical protein GRI89_02865 [Altererythrobacter salegens]|uniref:Helix-turn-helix domain-containing protein n=1 Tax=Croceibacterium salegens TaxID=1737568 RepID=A0A6I4SSG0_9SPHN|nr:hypothetical protein [Croceibacterium salegens]
MTKAKGNAPRLLDRAFDDRGVGGNAKHVFLYMCRVGNGSGLCFMTKGNLAAVSGLSPSTVSRSLKKLKATRRIVFVGTKPGTCASEYALYPGGQNDVKPRSNRRGEAGQNDFQNPSRNPERNRAGAVESLGKTARRRSATRVGVAVDEILDNIAEGIGSEEPGEGGS